MHCSLPFGAVLQDGVWSEFFQILWLNESSRSELASWVLRYEWISTFSLHLIHSEIVDQAWPFGIEELIVIFQKRRSYSD